MLLLLMFFCKHNLLQLQQQELTGQSSFISATNYGIYYIILPLLMIAYHFRFNFLTLTRQWSQPLPEMKTFQFLNTSYSDWVDCNWVALFQTVTRYSNFQYRTCVLHLWCKMYNCDLPFCLCEYLWKEILWASFHCLSKIADNIACCKGHKQCIFAPNYYCVHTKNQCFQFEKVWKTFVA